MGFFSALTGLLAGSGGGGVGTALQVGGDIAGYFLGKSANKKAAKSASKIAKKQLKLEQAAINEATRQYEETKTLAAPGVARLRQTVASPGRLTPVQADELQDTRRRTLNDLSRSGLRGSGRAVTTAFKNVESDFVNKALDANRQRGDQAASELAGPFFNATGQTANLVLKGADAESGALADQGEAQQGKTIANANLAGQTLGDVSSLIASEVKGRESRYGDRLAELEKKLGLNNDSGV